LAAAFFWSLQLSLCRRAITLFRAVRVLQCCHVLEFCHGECVVRKVLDNTWVRFHIMYPPKSRLSHPTRALFFVRFFLIGFYRRFAWEDAGYCNSRKWLKKVDICREKERLLYFGFVVLAMLFQSV